MCISHIFICTLYIPFYRPCVDRFISACRSGNLENVVTILEELKKEGEDVNVQDDNGISGLASAAAGGHESVVKYLLDNQASVKLETFHLGIICDVCGMYPMKGKRFKCMVCPDYDLCQECNVKGFRTNPCHPKHELFQKGW